MEKIKLSCGCQQTSDFSYTDFDLENGGYKLVIHKYCHGCGMHNFKGKEYTRKEWHAWIEEGVRE